MDADHWLEHIDALLGDVLGTEQRKAAVREAAANIQAYLRGNESPAAEMLRRRFEGWVERMEFMMPHEELDARLPQTLLRSLAEIAAEFGLSTRAAQEAKRTQISDAREERIKRAVDHLAAGWAEYECVHFVAARDEWQEALRRSEWSRAA